MTGWPLFFSTFSLIFFAELPDKTAFATLILATRGRPFAIFTGVALAFLVQTVFAVVFGGLIGMFPERWVRLGASLLFFAFAIHTWRDRDEEGAEAAADEPAASERARFFSAAWQAFLVIFVAEWGDLTQLATASLVARYREHVQVIFFAAVSALWAAAAAAVFLGNRLRHSVRTRGLRMAGAAVFLLMGLYFLFTWRQG